MNGKPELFSDGEGYERLMGRWSQRAGATFLDWLALPNGLKWLDVGCGNGAFTDMLMRKAAPASVVGVDPSEGQLAYARSRPGTRGAEFQQAGAEKLPFPDNSFDAAVMPLVISFVSDPVQAVAEMKRVVKPGGCLAAYMWDVEGGGLPLEPFNIVMREIGASPGGPPGSAASREDRMRAVWEQNKLSSIETRVIRIRIEFANFDDFWSSNAMPIGPTGAAIQRLLPEQKARVQATLRERLPQGPNGSISYEPFANAVKGRVPG
jgi:SAM-dependent methyltransferase